MPELPEIFLRQMFGLDCVFVHGNQEIYTINLTDLK